MGIFDWLRGGKRGAAPQPKATAPAPFAAQSPESSGSVERRLRPRKDARKGIKALIIDDSPTVVPALRKVLRCAG